MATYGYVRVSTREQHDDRQRIALREFGVDSRRIYADQESGKSFERPQYRRLLQRLRRDEDRSDPDDR